MKFNMRRNQQQHDVPPRRVRKDRSLLDEPRINEISDQLLKREIRDVVINTAHSLKAAASFKTTAFHELGQEIGEELTEFQLSTTKSFYDLKEHLEDHFTVVNETETALPSLFHNDTEKVCDARDDDMSLTDGGESRFDAEDTVEQNSLDTDDDDTAFVSVDLSKKSTGVDASTIAGDLTVTDADESTTPTVEDDGEKQAMEHLTGTFSAFSQCLGDINCADINCADITYGTGLFDDNSNNHNNHTNHNNNTKDNNDYQNNKVHDDDTASELVDEAIDWSKIVKKASTEKMYAPKACEKKEKPKAGEKKEKKWKKMKIFRRRRK